MSDTPRTNEQIVQHTLAGVTQDYVHAYVVRALELELAAANQRISELEAELSRIKRLPAEAWATLNSELMILLSQLARGGESTIAQEIVKLADKAKTYQDRTEAERVALKILLRDFINANPRYDASPDLAKQIYTALQEERE